MKGVMYITSRYVVWSIVRASLQCSRCQVADQSMKWTTLLHSVKVKILGAVPSFFDVYNCFMWLNIFSITMLGFLCTCNTMKEEVRSNWKKNCMRWFTIHTLHYMLLVQIKVWWAGHVAHTANKYTQSFGMKNWKVH